MLRLIYRALVKDTMTDDFEKAIPICSESIRKAVVTGVLMTATLYRKSKELFLYYEWIETEVSPDELLGPLEPFLEDWPGEPAFRKWVPMYDVFHYDVPANAAQWKRKLSIDERAGRIARIKPEMLGSYIFYHYQLQEERRVSGNKYCIIGLHENMIFHYEEHPVENSAPSFQGSLATSNTPPDWKKLMDPHFIPQINANGEAVNFIKLDPVFSW